MRRQHEQITHLPQVGDEPGRQALQGQSIAGRSGWHSPGRSTHHAQRSTIPGPFSSRVALLLVLALAVGTEIAHGATYVGGPITVDTTWSTAGSPYIVQSDVIVAAESGPAPVLTVQPSVQIKFDAGTGLYIGSGTMPGKLYAVATSTTRITFTANGSTQRGFHTGIFFDDGTDNTSQLVYCNIYYGGGANPGNVTVNACNATVKNCNIRYSSTAGIYLENAAKPVMSANSISYCSGAAMSFDPSCRVASVTSVTGSTTNGTNMVEVRPGNLTGSNETWRKLSLAYHVLDRVMVFGTATTATKLVISGGATLKFAEAGHLVIGSWDDPSLKATLYTVGSATNITKFTSAQATPAPGDWPGIIMLDGATDTLSSIQYATVEFAGRDTNAGIWLYSCKPTIKNSVTVKNTAGNGIFMLESASTITGVTLANNTQYGIRIEGDAARAANLSAITFSGNGTDAVEYWRPEIREASETLPYLGTTTVYDCPNGLSVRGANSIAAKLSVAGGAKLRMLNGSSLSVGSDLAEEPAILVASGTSALPIVIEGSDPSPANWGTVWLNDSLQDSSTSLDYVTSHYGTTGFYLTNCSPTLRNCSATAASGSGIVLGGVCAPVITGGASENNGAYPLEIDGGSLMSGITGLSCTGNAQNVVRYVARELRGSGDSLPNLGVAYQVEGSLFVRGNTGESPLLRLAAGVEMRFPEHERLVVGSSSPDAAGALEAIGTPSQPILLRSQTGQWAGVYVDQSSLDESTRLSYVTVMEGGQDDAALYIAGSKPTIDNLTISTAGQYGIILWEAAPTITTATITGAGTAPILASANCRLKNLSGFGFDPNVFISHSGGIISGESETLPALGPPYRLSGWLEVYGDLSTAASLTLAAGTRLEFAGATGLNVGTWADASQGILISAGTESSPVVLTGIDGAPWDSVSFLDGSVDGSTRLDYTTIELAGAGSNRAVYVGQCSPIFYNCRIERSPGYGLWAESSPALQVTDSVFDSNGSYPVSVDIMTSLAAFTGNVFLNNNPDAAEQRGGNVTSDSRIAYTEQPYVLNGGIAIHGSTDTAATLTIDPGVVLRLNTTDGITVGWPTGEKGRIVADGTVSLPITFTTNLSPVPGAWHGFELYTASPASSLKHCTIEWAGNVNERSVDLIGGAAVFENCTIRQGLGAAISVHDTGASATLTDCTLDSFTAHAVELADGSAFSVTGGTISNAGTYGVTIGAASPTLSGVTITQCGTAPIRAGTASRLKNIASLTLDTGAWIEYQGGRLQGEDEAFPAVPILLSGTLQVANDTSTATTLTIPGGTSLIFPSGSGLTIGLPTGEKGTLICSGTSASPIVLDSTSQSAAGWIGLELYSSSGASSLAFTTITHAGQSNSRTVLIDNASPLLSNCTISAGSGYGAYITRGAPSITNTLFQNLTSYPVSVDIMTSLAGFTGNTFQGNGVDAVEQRGGDVTSDARIAYIGQEYVLNGGISIHGSTGVAATLSIDPAVVLKFNTTNGITVGLPTGEKGRLVAEGSEALPITLTTNLTPAPAAWHGVEVYTSSPASVLTHCVIEYAGNGNEKSVELIGGAASFANCTLREGQGDGLVLRSAGASATLTDCTIDGFTRNGVDLQDTVAFSMTDGTIQNCGTYGLQLAAVSPTLNGVTITACGSAPLRATTSSRLKNIGTLTIDPSATVSYVGGRLQGEDEVLPGLTYQLTTGLEIANDTMTPTTLTLLPAATLRFPSGQKLIVGGTSGQLGSLLTQGTATQPVTLTGYTQSRGSWGGLELRDSTFDATTRIVHTTVQYAGSPGVVINSCSPAFEDSRITQSLGAAISASGSSASFLRCTVDANGGDGLSASSGGSIVLDSTTFSSNTWGINSSTGLSITGCTVASNTSGGIKLTGGSTTITGGTVASSPNGIYLDAATAALTNLTISGCTGYPLSISALSSLAGSSGLTLSTNGKEAIEHRAGTITDTQTLPALGVPYDVSADLSVTGPRGGTALLTLEGGTTLRFATGKALQVANGGYLDQSGALRCLGTAGNPVTLRSQNAGQAGSWVGLTVWYTADASQLLLSYLTILDATAGLRAYASPTTIAGLDIENCSNYGLALGTWNAPESQRVTVTSSSISRNTGSGVQFVGPAQILDSLITENTGSGVLQEYDYANSILERCSIVANGLSGLFMYHGTNTTRECSITGNGRVGIEVPAAADSAFKLSVQSCTISGNQQGGATCAVAFNHDLGQNYWGDPSGPGGVGPGTGDSVGSVFLIYEPWREGPYDPAFAIDEAAVTNRVVPAQQSEASFWAGATGQADWTLEIRDQTDAVRYSSTATAMNFFKRWDCLDQSGQALPAGSYRWRILASKTGSPETVATPLTGTFQVSADVPRAEVQTPTEHSKLGSFEVVATTSGQPTSWTLYGGPGDGWVPQVSSLQQLATGTGDVTLDTMAAVDLTGQTGERYVCALVAVAPGGTIEQRITIIKGPLTVSPNPFSPNSDQVEDTTTFSGTFDAVSWTLTIRDSQGAVQRTWNGTGGSISVTWDGQDSGGSTVADGDYDYVLDLVDAADQTDTVTGSVVVLSTAPFVELLSPAEGATVTNLNGAPTVTVRGNITVPTGRTVNWRVDVGSGTVPSSWTTLATGQASATLTDYLFTTWTIDPSLYPSGAYQLRLAAVIIGGAEHYDQSGIQIADYLIEILSPARAFNPRLGESAAIRIHTGLASEITVDAYRVADSTQSEQPVLAKRLVEALAVQPGTVDIAWDGRQTDGTLASDYIYAIQVTVFQGGSPLGSTGDTSRAFYDVEADGPGVSQPPTIDPAGAYTPYKNAPFKVTYPVYLPALVGFRAQNLTPPVETTDLYRTEMQPPGTHVETWDATRGTEIFAGANWVSIRANVTVNDGPTNYNNLIALYGNVPRIESLSLDRPTFYADDFGDAPVSAMLYYTLDQTGDVTVELTSLASGAVIDTWSLPAQSAGAQEFSWNGMTRDGRWIDQGEYRWRLAAAANGFTSRSVYALMRVTH